MVWHPTQPHFILTQPTVTSVASTLLRVTRLMHPIHILVVQKFIILHPPTTNQARSHLCNVHLSLRWPGHLCHPSFFANWLWKQFCPLLLIWFGLRVTPKPFSCPGASVAGFNNCCHQTIFLSTCPQLQGLKFWILQPFWQGQFCCPH